ncbi:MAG TPA: DUF1272 domain-containing protein [Burkholderiaceae bacterium]
MLELRPICEHCAKALPPDSSEAMICSFECTFCSACVHGVLHNVCPNCGGGFTARPVRPQHDLKNGNCLANYPATTTIKHKPVDPAQHLIFAAPIEGIAPEKR